MAEKMKKGPSEAGRKTLKCPHKQGINLNMREQKGNPRLTLLVGCLAIVILAGCVAKFGVIDQYRRLDAAQAAYASVHTEYTQMQELLKGYDRLLMEYRTYSMEWATDGSEDNGTLVDRQKALDLLEQVHFAVIRGNISEIKTLAQGSGKTRAFCPVCKRKPYCSRTAVKVKHGFVFGRRIFCGFVIKQLCRSAVKHT